MTPDADVTKENLDETVAAQSNPQSASALVDGADVSAEIERWLIRHKREAGRVSDADWNNVLRQIADALQQFEEMEIFRKDPGAQAIYARLRRSADVEDFNEQLDLFLYHMASIFNEQTGGQADVQTRMPVGNGARARLETMVQSALDQDGDAMVRARTRMRL